MEILLSKTSDIDAIFELYDAATAFQKKVGTNSWKGFEHTMVEKEIAAQRHFVIRDDNQISATFVLAFSDPIIWKEADKDPSVYIHRIATHPDFRGRNYVQKILYWTKEYAKKEGKNFVRLDTTSGNEPLNQYYLKCGFTYKGNSEIEWTNELPEHYKDGSFALFEIAVNK
ncbi:GNAT family N-acetyltransferase [Flavobacterium sp.]